MQTLEERSALIHHVITTILRMQWLAAGGIAATLWGLAAHFWSAIPVQKKVKYITRPLPPERKKSFSSIEEIGTNLSKRYFVHLRKKIFEILNAGLLTDVAVL